MTKRIGHIVYQTHWDNEWYFTDRESQVQLTYHMREMIKMLEEGAVNHFLLDGQTAIVADYLSVCPEDKKRLSALIKQNKLFIGPWLTQTETFAVSGESMVNNLRLGISYAENMGACSMVSYLPDSFGHPVDFPQIFNGVGIEHFSFRRGMGDKHKLPTEFYWEGANGSRVLTNVMLDGYDWAYQPFFSGELLSPDVLPECTTSEKTSLELVAEASPFDEFLLPLGSDQTPIRDDFKSKLNELNDSTEDYGFKETTFQDYFKLLESVCGDTLPTFKGEFLDTQYSRVHKSINSVRYDVKQLQDEVERLMTYNLQPLMSMVDSLALPWEKGLVDEIWNLLCRSQTHSVCTNTDRTNARIFERLKMAQELAESTHAYLLRKIALTVDVTEGRTPLVVTNTLPTSRKVTARYKMFTPTLDFSLWMNDEEIPYSIIGADKEYGGIQRKDVSLHVEEKYYYHCEIETCIELKGMSYQVIEVDTNIAQSFLEVAPAVEKRIESKHLVLSFSQGQFDLTSKALSKTFENILTFENDGDEGDNYDHCPADNDWVLPLDFSDVQIETTRNLYSQTMTVSGSWMVPKDLIAREHKQKDCSIPYELSVTVENESSYISVSIRLENQAKNHRIRMIIDGQIPSEFSIAGTQFSEVKRETNPAELVGWLENGFVEEPTTTEPLLNCVSMVNESRHLTVLTKGCKEYQVIGERFDKMAVTLFRACGHFGLPDLSRRPGRASGVSEKITATPDSQLQKTLEFDLSFSVSDDYCANKIRQKYVEFATLDGYYHEQSLSKTGEFNISYFHTNKLNTEVPTSFSLLEMADSDLVFSTLVKDAARPGGYLIRLYNCGNEDVPLPEIKGFTVEAETNLLGRNPVEPNPIVSAGKIVTLALC